MDICRLCLCTNLVRNDVFAEGSTLYNKMLYLPIQISRKDELPQKICDKCINKLEICYEFCKTAIDSQNMFLSNLHKMHQKKSPIFPKAKSHQSTQTDLDFDITVKIENNYDKEVCESENKKNYDDEYELEIESNDFDNNIDNIEVLINCNEMNDSDPLVMKIKNEKSNYIEEDMSVSQINSKESTVKSTTSLKKKQDDKSVSRISSKENTVKSTTSLNKKQEDKSVSRLISKEKPIKSTPTSKKKQDKSVSRINSKENTVKSTTSLKRKQEDKSVSRLISKEKTTPALKRKHVDNSDDEVNSEEFDGQLDWNILSKLKVTRTKRQITDDSEDESEPGEKSKVNKESTCCLCLVYRGPIHMLLHHYEKHGSQSNADDNILPIKLSNKELRCPLCNMMFRSHEYYLNHYTYEHKLHPYQCIVCNLICEGPQEALKHGLTHNFNKDVAAVVYVCMCDLCPKRFQKRRDMLIHRKQVHPTNFKKNITYKCMACPRSFTSISKHAVHRRSHAKELLYPCVVCGKVLSSAEKYKLHMRAHTGYSPHVCKLCGESFKRSDTLITHVRTHTGSKPYVCSICDRGFSQRSAMIIHQRCHTGQKPYLCDSCGKNFQTQGLLTTHINANKCTIAGNFTTDDRVESKKNGKKKKL